MADYIFLVIHSLAHTCAVRFFFSSLMSKLCLRDFWLFEKIASFLTVRKLAIAIY